MPIPKGIQQDVKPDISIVSEGITIKAWACDWIEDWRKLGPCGWILDDKKDKRKKKKEKRFYQSQAFQEFLFIIY